MLQRGTVATQAMPPPLFTIGGGQRRQQQGGGGRKRGSIWYNYQGGVKGQKNCRIIKKIEKYGFWFRIWNNFRSLGTTSNLLC